jgi:hypothetical protein
MNEGKGARGRKDERMDGSRNRRHQEGTAVSREEKGK